MPRFILLALLISSMPAADLVLSGTWSGAAAQIPPGTTVVLAMYDRNGTCCGGPEAAFAGLANLRTALQARADVRLVAVDVTAGGTMPEATAAAASHGTEGIPLLLDAARATPGSLGVTIDMTMTYVIRASDGSQQVVYSPNLVKRHLGG